MRRSLGLSVLCVLLAAGTRLAQTVSSTTGAIDGKVTDTSNAVLPGVTVTIASQAIIGSASAAPLQSRPGADGPSYVVSRKVMVPMRDGIQIAADIYVPAENGRQLPGPFPAILMKHPYGRAGAERDGIYYATHGYVFVMADCRGSHDSEGVFYLYLSDGKDGYDLVEWIAKQPWSNGAVATDGGSHSGYTQYATGINRPPHLKVQFIREASDDYHDGGAWQGGAYLQEHNLAYALSQTLNINNVGVRPHVRRRMEEANKNREAWIEVPAPRHLELFTDVPETTKWYSDWMRHADYDEYWKQPGLNLREHYSSYPDIPMYFLTGWQDYFEAGTLRAYLGMKAATRSPKKLIVGPWIHGPDNVARTSNGDVEFGSDAAIDFLAFRDRWMAHWLKNHDTGVLKEPPVRIFVMGTGDGHKTPEGKLFHGGSWRSEQEWPLARAVATRYYLHGGGRLGTEAPTTAPPSAYTYDPTDPVPTIAGFGAYDQRCRADLPHCKNALPLSARSDNLVFRTAPLDKDTEVTGPITTVLYAATDAPDTDFAAKLIDEYPATADLPNGFALILNAGIVRARYHKSVAHAERIEAGRIYAFTIDLWATSNVFKKGHRIRLDVSSSNFPRFDANPNTGETIGFHTRSQLAHNTLYHDDQHASYVELPVVDGRAPATAGDR